MAVSPMVSPSGYIYCKECIYENLLSQKQRIQQDKIEYEKYMDSLNTEQMEKQVHQEKKQLEKFIRNANGLGITGDTTQSKSVKEQLAAEVDLQSIEQKKKDLKRTSFWIPEFTPNADRKVEKPNEKTVDPMNDKPLRLKQLMPATFHLTSDKHILCALTKKEITHQNAVLLKPSGQIILESCLKTMVLPSMTCPLTNVKLRKKDIVYLQTGGTGYSAHNSVEAKKYRPSMA